MSEKERHRIAGKSKAEDAGDSPTKEVKERPAIIMAAEDGRLEPFVRELADGLSPIHKKISALVAVVGDVDLDALPNADAIKDVMSVIEDYLKKQEELIGLLY
jgi:hypothetical protein